MELTQQVNLRFVSLVGILSLSLAYLAKDYVSLARENDLAQREIKGVREEIADGRYDHVTIKTRTITLPGNKVVYVPPEGKVTITPKDPTKRLEDVVDIHYQKSGLTFEPGLQVTVLPKGAGVDAKLLYFHRLGLGVGLNYFESPLLGDYFSPTANVSYRLDRIRFIHNLEAVFGISVIPVNRGYLGVRMSL